MRVSEMVRRQPAAVGVRKRRRARVADSQEECRRRSVCGIRRRWLSSTTTGAGHSGTRWRLGASIAGEWLTDRAHEDEEEAGRSFNTQRKRRHANREKREGIYVCSRAKHR